MTAQTVLPHRTPSRSRRAGLAGVATVLAMGGVLAGVVGTAEAGTTSTIKPVSIVMKGDPALGSTVSFVVDMNGNRAKNPRVVVQCSQNGALVYGVNGGLTSSFKLGGDSSPWVTAGGGASCTTYVADYVYAKGQWTVTTFPGAIFYDARG